MARHSRVHPGWRPAHVRAGVVGVVRHVGLFCDNECDTPDFTVDVRVENRDEAFATLRALADEAGWLITPALDPCPACAAAAHPHGPTRQGPKESDQQ